MNVSKKTKVISRHFKFTEKENKLLIDLAEELGITYTEMVMKALRYYRRELDKNKQSK